MKIFSLTYFLTCGSPVNLYYIYFKSKSFGNKYQTKNAHISWDHYFFTYLQQVRDSLQAQPGYQNCKITPRLVNNISDYKGNGSLGHFLSPFDIIIFFVFLTISYGVANKRWCRGRPHAYTWCMWWWNVGIFSVSSLISLFWFWKECLSLLCHLRCIKIAWKKIKL